MVHGKLKCPNCNQELELSATKAPAALEPQAAPKSDDIGEILERINSDGLDGKAREFVADMRSRYAQYGARTLCSDKQREWLRTLAG